jgi:hypothetical protein
MLDGGLVAKASSFKPRPSLLYLEAQMNGRNVSRVDKEAMHSFISLMLTRNLGLAGTGKPIHARFERMSHMN